MISFSAGKRKIFVLDTNIILHDSSCINQFDEHDIVIPIAVIEELDRFKKGNEILNCNAREFARALDALTGDRIFNGGVPIGPGKGKITVCLDREFHDTLKANFPRANRTTIFSMPPTTSPANTALIGCFWSPRMSTCE
jgi:PhoH-like ATPase